MFDPMEDALTQVTDPNIVLETVTNRKSYLSNLNPVPKTIPKEKITNHKPKKPVPKTVYNDYSDRTTREMLIDRMIESPEERGRAARFARELGINEQTAQRWQKQYQKTNEVPYKKPRANGLESLFKSEHQEYVRKLLDEDPQLYSVDIIDKIAEQLMGFRISKAQLNHI